MSDNQAKDSAERLYIQALAAEENLNNLGRDPTDDEVDTVLELTERSYETIPTSPEAMVRLIDLAIVAEFIQPDIDPKIYALLSSLRAGARVMASLS